MKHLFTMLALLLAILATPPIFGQEIPRQPIYLSIQDSTTKLPLELCEVTLYYAPVDGSPSTMESQIVLEDQYTTKGLQVGAMTTILIKKKGYERKKIAHYVHQHAMDNILEAQLVPIIDQRATLVVEGELSWQQDGIRHPAPSEVVRIHCNKGYKTTITDEMGYYRLELQPHDYEGVSELHVRAAYSSQKLYGQDKGFRTECDYHQIDFNLEPNYMETVIQVQIWDSITRLPLDSVFVTIMHNNQIIAKEIAGPGGKLTKKITMGRTAQNWICEVSANGYASKRLSLGINENVAKFQLCRNKINIIGNVAGKTKNPGSVVVSGEGFPEISIPVQEGGQFSLAIPRVMLPQNGSIHLQVSKGSTYGKRDIDVHDILATNDYRIPHLIHPKSKGIGWRNQMHIGMGLSIGIRNLDFGGKVDSMVQNINLFRAPIYLLFGFKRMPHFLIGVSLDPMLVVHDDSIRAFNYTMALYERIRTFFSPISITGRYVLSPKFLPWFKVFLGTSQSTKTHQFFGGIGFQPFEVFGFEFFANAMWRRVPKQNMEWRSSGVPQLLGISHPLIFRPSVGFNLNYRISW